MNLRQLKKMINEEYSNFANYKVSEQADMDEPSISVGPGDVKIGGGDEDSEDTLRQIYDMLKAHFEGDDDKDMDDMDDMDDKDDKDDKEDDKPAAPKAPKAPAAKPPAPKAPAAKDDEDDKALQERFQKLANIIKG